MPTTHRLDDVQTLPAPAPSMTAVPAPGVTRAPLSWTEAAIVVLMRTEEPLRASQIVTRIHEYGLVTSSRSRTPAQSINRDLHTALRHGDPRVVAGPEPGQFRASGQTATTSGVAQRVSGPPRPVVPRGPRLPIEPLQAAVEARGGLRAVATGTSAADAARELTRLTRTYHRSVERGWIDLYDADTICARHLRLHPSLLYGMGWWDTLQEADRVADLGDDVDDDAYGGVDQDQVA